MEGRVNRRIDTLVVNIILGRTSQRCQRVLQMKAFQRVSNPLLHDEIRDAMTKGDLISQRNKVCVLARAADLDKLASANNQTIVSFRVVASQANNPFDPLVDQCVWPGRDLRRGAQPTAPQGPSRGHCTCHTAKLVFHHDTNTGAGYCTCANSSAFLCKHIHAAAIWSGGLAVAGILKDALRLSDDPDFVLAEQDDNADFTEHVGIAVLDIVVSDDEEDASPVDDNSMARAELVSDITQNIQRLLSRSDLPKAQRDQACQEVIYALQDEIRRGQTKVRPPIRPQPGDFAGRAGPGPRPVPTSDKADAFRAAIGIGRPRTAASVPHVVPLPSLVGVQQRLAMRSSSTVPPPTSALTQSSVAPAANAAALAAGLAVSSVHAIMQDRVDHDMAAVVSPAGVVAAAAVAAAAAAAGPVAGGGPAATEIHSGRRRKVAEPSVAVGPTYSRVHEDQHSPVKQAMKRPTINTVKESNQLARK